MTRKALNVQALYEALDLIRGHTGMTWRDIAADTGISPSTLTRISQGHRPDADALVTLLAWLRVPADRFTVDVPDATCPAEHAEPRTAAGHPAHTPGDSQ